MLAEFRQSDELTTLELPSDDRLKKLAAAIERALAVEDPKTIRSTSANFLAVAADFYQVHVPPLRVLAARPVRVWESGFRTELFGDYHTETAVIRVWMRTAVHKRVTSFGTFFNTLCHEFCHHLDFERFGFQDSPHTRGFYERTAILYHRARETPQKKLFWMRMPGERWRIDWRRLRG